MKRAIKVPFYLLAGVVFLLIVSLGFATVSQINMGALRARVLFLEKMMQGGVDEAEIEDMIARLKKLQPRSNPRLEELLSLIGELEKQLPLPVVTNYSQIEKLRQGKVYLVGVVTKVTEKSPNVFLYVNDVYVPIFNHPGRVQIQVGDLIAIEGSIKTYNDMYEVVPVTNTSFMVLEH